jgi:hypothetical protein
VCEGNTKHINRLCFNTVSELVHAAASDNTGLWNVNTLLFNLFSWMKSKIICNISRSPYKEDENKTKRKLVARRDYCSIANGRTEIFAIFRGLSFYLSPTSAVVGDKQKLNGCKTARKMYNIKFRGVFRIFRGISKFYLFAPRFIAEPQTIFWEPGLENTELRQVSFWCCQQVLYCFD